MIEPEYAELFSETVHLYPSASVNAYGKRTWSPSGSTASAHLDMTVRLVRNAAGREVEESGRVYLYGVFDTLTLDSLIVLPNSASPVILGVDFPHDEHGAHHTVIRMGSLNQ